MLGVLSPLPMNEELVKKIKETWNKWLSSQKEKKEENKGNPTNDQ